MLAMRQTIREYVLREKDKTGPQLLKLAENGGQLWCEELSSHYLNPHEHARSASFEIVFSTKSCYLVNSGTLFLKVSHNKPRIASAHKFAFCQM